MEAMSPVLSVAKAKQTQKKKIRTPPSIMVISLYIVFSFFVLKLDNALSI